MQVILVGKNLRPALPYAARGRELQMADSLRDTYVKKGKKNFAQSLTTFLKQNFFFFQMGTPIRRTLFAELTEA